MSETRIPARPLVEGGSFVDGKKVEGTEPAPRGPVPPPPKTKKAKEVTDG